MGIQVYNTLTKTKEPFEPVVPGKVGIYLCGPTVYAPAHIGHMVGPVIFDTIKRYLTYNGFDVTLVVNITDVDDKLMAKARERGISMAQVAEENTADYLANLKAFHVDTIDQMPKATENIDEIIRFIEKLIERDYAYVSDGDVYFEVSKDDGYGKLSNRTADSQQGEGGEAASKKREPGDFALWKAAKPDEPSWRSPWGKGRPGWHIECSAMSHKLLGETFDIHGGGLDLVFPHHENELAQSECCHGRPMVRYWMHNGLMQSSTSAGKLGGRSDRQASDDDAAVEAKISRSKGAGGLAELIQLQSGERIRFFLLRTHYRSTIAFGEDEIEKAGVALETFYRFFERYQRITSESFFDLDAATRRSDGDFRVSGLAVLADIHRHRAGFLQKMDDDFNTGAAVSDLFELVRVLNRFIDQWKLEESLLTEPQLTALRQGAATLRELAGVLGLFHDPCEKIADADDHVVCNLIDLLIDIRTDARNNKDFATSDKIRDSLAAIRITLEDRKGGTDWRWDA